MEKIKIKTAYKKIIADTITPVSSYLKLRDHFPNSLLLESSDYQSKENSYSYICCNPLFTFKAEGNIVREYKNREKVAKHNLDDPKSLIKLLDDFVGKFKAENLAFPFTTSGLFGYTSYDAIKYFEDVKLNSLKQDYKNIPEVLYQFFQFVLVFDQFRNELYIFRHAIEGDENSGSSIEDLIEIIKNRNFSNFEFSKIGDESSNLSNEDFKKLVTKGKEHCRKGDVFQIVFSREFKQSFKGDEFNVYRALRAINPSPYLFYFDYGNFKLFGSSPEAQLTIQKRVAAIHPIAGTYKRQGSIEEDRKYAKKLREDVKENSEHVMLVDLARNDLSRNSSEVKVEKYCEIQYYSHVIHMVSKISSVMDTGSNAIQLVADTFPAGTLTGAPKIKAMQLIDKYENHQRGFYGGAVGFIDLNGDYNHAIMIRSYLSKNNQLVYQAGAGIVINSVEENELMEVNNKIAAVREAITKACNL